MTTFTQLKSRIKMLKQLAKTSPTLPYVVAVSVTVIAVAIRWLLNPLLEQTMILVTIYGALAFSTWLGGYRPALVTALLGYLLCNYFIIAPHFAFHLNTEQVVGFLVYCMTCGIIIILGEITRKAERRLLEKEHDLRETLESITDSFYSLDTEWRFTYLNPAALQVLDRKASELLNKEIWEEYQPLIGTEIEALYRKVMAEKISGNTTTFYPPHAKWYEVRAYPSNSGLSVYFQDVTKRIKAEQRLKQQSEELAEMDRRKNEFLATLAHELRNPLAPIRNSLSIMQLKGNDGSIVEKSRLLIERQVSQMVRLIDDLMDVSRINHGKLELKRANIAFADVINAAVEASRPSIETAGLHLTVNPLPESIILNADSTRLTQVFLNLLNNAAKFTNPGGKITINAELSANAENEQKLILVTVSDTGIGITPADQSKIFEGFTQLSNSLKRSHGGLGVGLMLVKRIVEMHYGKVTVHSAGPGLGATFTVALPVLSDNASDISQVPPITDMPIPSAVQDNEPGEPLRILVVDDNYDVAMSLARYFDALGHETNVVHDGATAIETAARYRPDVIFLDIGMPDLNGYEVASYIRKQDWGATIKLYAVTGWGQEEDRRKSAIAGFDAHLVKPVYPSVLNKLLTEATS